MSQPPRFATAPPDKTHIAGTKKTSIQREINTVVASKNERGKYKIQCVIIRLFTLYQLTRVVDIVGAQNVSTKDQKPATNIATSTPSIADAAQRLTNDGERNVRENALTGTRSSLIAVRSAKS